MITVKKYITFQEENFIQGDYVEILTNEDRFLGVITEIENNYLIITSDTGAYVVRYAEIINIRER